jgi:excisionase family DNA binding protein
MDNNLFLTVEEAASRLNVNPETIRRRIRKGVIKAQLLPGPRGDQYSIPVSELTIQEAQIIPIQQLPPAIIDQLSNVIAKTLQNAVEPLQAKIEEQNKEIIALKGQLDKIEASNLRKSIDLNLKLDEFINTTRAENQASKKGWWKFW